MPDKHRHHFVPRFYLQGFASAPRRINVFNLARTQPIRDASLRRQCYRHRFYGRHETLEDAFAELESFVAPVLRSVERNSKAPRVASREHQAIVAFVALQMLRTTAALESAKSILAKVTEDLGEEGRRVLPVPSDPAALALSLRNYHETTLHLSDLRAEVVRTDPAVRFITSDNPVCTLNPYCQRVHEFGCLGADSSGLVIILPLSPNLALILFDPGVYQLSVNSLVHVPIATTSDVVLLNTLQAAYAEANLYFADWSQAATVRTIAARGVAARPQVRMDIAVSEVDPKQEIRHIYRPQPDLELQLTFVRVRRGASRVPVPERIRRFRSRPFSRPRIVERAGELGSVRFKVTERR